MAIVETLNNKLALIDYGDVFQPATPVSSHGIGSDHKRQLLWEYPFATIFVVEDPHGDSVYFAISGEQLKAGKSSKIEKPGKVQIVGRIRFPGSVGNPRGPSIV